MELVPYSDEHLQLTEALELDRARVRGWGIVHALVWGLDETLHEDLVASAELLAAL